MCSRKAGQIKFMEPLTPENPEPRKAPAGTQTTPCAACGNTHSCERGRAINSACRRCHQLQLHCSLVQVPVSNAPFLPSAPQTYQNVLDFRHHFTHAKEMVLALQSPIQAMYMPTGFLGSDDLDTPDTGDAFEGDLESRNCGTVIYSKSSSDSAVQPGKMWLDARDEDSPEHVLTTMRVELGNIGLLVADSPPATYHQVCQTTASLGRKINTLESIWKRT